MLRWMGTGEICFVFPVSLSVSSWISLRTRAAEEKSHCQNCMSLHIPVTKSAIIDNLIKNFQVLKMIIHVQKSVNRLLGKWANSAYSSCPSLVLCNCNTKGRLVTIPVKTKEESSNKANSISIKRNTKINTYISAHRILEEENPSQLRFPAQKIFQNSECRYKTVIKCRGNTFPCSQDKQIN